jgi:hypothetical protein
MNTPPPRSPGDYMPIPRPYNSSTDSDYSRNRRRRYVESPGSPPSLRSFEDFDESFDFAKELDRQREHQKRLDQERHMKRDIDKVMKGMLNDDWIFNMPTPQYYHRYHML